MEVGVPGWAGDEILQRVVRETPREGGTGAEAWWRRKHEDTWGRSVPGRRNVSAKQARVYMRGNWEERRTER